MVGRGDTGLCPLAHSESGPVESWESIIATKTVCNGSFHLKVIQTGK
jgi:hypothetical protein